MSERSAWTVNRITFPIREGDGRIQEYFCFQVVDASGKAVANAFTIETANKLASLPDLVAALQDVKELFDEWDGPLDDSVRESVEAALAKAGVVEGVT